jgi:hypothetical protein
VTSDSPAAGNAASPEPITEAIETAYRAVREHFHDAAGLDAHDEAVLRETIHVVLEAAGPLIAAGERARWTRIEPDPDQPGYNRGVFDVSGFAAEEIERHREKIRAGERERCASLAESVQAEYIDTQPPGNPIGDGRYVHRFADLLRKEPGNG